MGRLIMVNIWLIRYRDPRFLSKPSEMTSPSFVNGEHGRGFRIMKKTCS